MRIRWYFILFLINLLVVGGVAALESSPGYMDAEYYLAGGQRLAGGFGFSEPYLWNYLDAPTGLPHASHLYWMPLASLVAGAGMKLAGNIGFFEARWPFLLLTAAIAPLTACAAFRLSGKTGHAILAGLLAVFSGFYLPYAGTTDTFSIFMLVGTIFILASGAYLNWHGSGARLGLLAGCLGVLAGLMHLSRADGLIWLGFAWLVILTREFASLRGPTLERGEKTEGAHTFSLPRGVGLALVVLGGYIAVMSPWYIRNIHLFGGLFSPGASHTLWLTNYDEMFVLDPGQLDYRHWLTLGTGGILASRWEALAKNLQTALIVQGGIFLVPLVIAGAWRYRKDPRVRLAGLAWATIILVMTLVFPFAGYRGGFLHSGAAVQPLLWAMVPSGLDGFVRWGNRVRRWNLHQAQRVFAIGLVAIAVVMSGLVVQRKVIGDQSGEMVWNQPWQIHVRLGAELDQLDADPQAPVLVNNPPGFWLATNRSAVVTPYGDESALIRAAERFRAEYILLDENHVDALDRLYDQPQTAHDLVFITTIEGTHIFKVAQ